MTSDAIVKKINSTKNLTGNIDFERSLSTGKLFLKFGDTELFYQVLCKTLVEHGLRDQGIQY